MLIGLDFDNTLVGYDALFHAVALEWGVIGADCPPNKLAVRDRLRAEGRESVWTALQGEVYGARMVEAAIYPGADDFLRWARGAGHRVVIVSHKTQYPFAGPRHDLHAAAAAWIARHLGRPGRDPGAPDAVYFEPTKADKLARIAQVDGTGCAVFLDDLPEILLDPAFPAHTVRVLFDPDTAHAGAGLPSVRSWDDFRHRLADG